MPIYEYQCDACGHRFETIRKFSDAPIETCPKCGGHVQKLQAAPAFQLKGSGWYITDYGKKDSGSSGKGGSEQKSGSSESSSGSSSSGSSGASGSGDSAKTAGESKSTPAKSGNSKDD